MNATNHENSGFDEGRIPVSLEVRDGLQRVNFKDGRSNITRTYVIYSSVILLACLAIASAFILFVRAKPMPLFAYVSNPNGILELTVMRADGSGKRVLAHDWISLNTPAWSPDGESIAFGRDWATNDGKQRGLYHVDVASGTEVFLTPDFPYAMTWSPDNEWVLYIAGNHGASNLMRVHRDGSARERLTTFAQEIVHSPVWSPERDWLYFHVVNCTNVTFCSDQMSDEIYRIRADGSGLELAPTQYKPASSATGDFQPYKDFRLLAGVSRQSIPLYVERSIDGQLFLLDPDYGGLIDPVWSPTN